MQTPYNASKGSRFGWALYDWASSPVPTLHATFVFAVYFTTTVMPEGGSVAWAWMTGLTALAVALCAPFLGRYADSTGRIKSFLIITLIIGASAAALLWFVQPDPSFAIFALAISALSIFFMESSIVFYNAMLAKMTKAENMGKLSGFAWGGGYVGAVVALALVLAIFILPETPPFGLDKAAAEHVRATMIFAAIWAIIFSIPIMAFVPSIPKTPMQGSFANQMRQSVRAAIQIPDMVRFLIARMAFNDGLVTLFAFGGIYAAKVFDFTQQEILLFAIALNVSAGIGAILGGFADDRLGSVRTMRLSLYGLLIFGSLAILAPSKMLFWIAGIALGLFVGPSQAAARTYVARRSPEHSKASIFGLYMVSGKLTSFIGPLCYGWLVLATGTERAGMGVVLVLIFIGLVLLPKSEGPSTA